MYVKQINTNWSEKNKNPNTNNYQIRKRFINIINKWDFPMQTIPWIITLRGFEFSYSIGWHKIISKENIFLLTMRMLKKQISHINY